MAKQCPVCSGKLTMLNQSFSFKGGFQVCQKCMTKLNKATKKTYLGLRKKTPEELKEILQNFENTQNAAKQEVPIPETVNIDSSPPENPSGKAIDTPKTVENQTEVDQSSKKAQEEKVKKGCFGCLGIIAVFWFIGWLMTLFGGADVTIENGIARFDKKINPDLAVRSMIIHEMAGEVFKIATKEKEVEKVEITLFMDASRLVDKYGNPGEGFEKMGVITIKDLDEVRKYRDSEAYQYSDEVEAFFEANLHFMPYQKFLD